MLTTDIRHRALLLFLSRLTPVWQRLHQLEERLPKGRSIRVLLKEAPPDELTEALFPPTAQRPPDGFRTPVTLQIAMDNRFIGPREYHLGVTHETIRKWRRSELKAAPQQDLRAFRHLGHVLCLMEREFQDKAYRDDCRELRRMVSDFANGYANGFHDIYAAGAILSMTMSETQRALDTIIQSAAPLLEFAYYPSMHEAESDLRFIGGLYYVWMRRDDFWMQCTMQIRYVVVVAERPMLRAKLHVPNIYKDKQLVEEYPRWEHDGFARMRGKTVYLIFEKRAKQDQDFMFFVGKKKDETYKNGLLLVGDYLTLGQNADQSTASGLAVFNRRDGVPYTDPAAQKDQRQIMLDGTRVPPEAEVVRFLDSLLPSPTPIHGKSDRPTKQAATSSHRRTRW